MSRLNRRQVSDNEKTNNNSQHRSFDESKISITLFDLFDQQLFLYVIELATTNVEEYKFENDNNIVKYE